MRSSLRLTRRVPPTTKPRAGDKTLATTRLLADSTDNSPAAFSPVAEAPRVEETAPQEPGSDANATPKGPREDSTMALDLGDSPLMLEDVSTDGLQIPPEPANGWEDRYKVASAIDNQPAPTPSMFPGTLV